MGRLAEWGMEIEKMFTMRVEETKKLWEGEGIRHGGPVHCYDHVESRTWGHLNVFGCECVIECRLPRGQKDCQGTGKMDGL